MPRPLKAEEEREYFSTVRAGRSGGQKQVGRAQSPLLVSHILKKYYVQAGDQDDLISIGTIGLIEEEYSTFKPDKKVRLATYASRCIENEILMYFRSQRRCQGDVSLSDSIDSDREGNALSRSWMSSASMTICWKPWIPGIPALRYANAWSTV